MVVDVAGADGVVAVVGVDVGTGVNRLRCSCNCCICCCNCWIISCCCLIMSLRFLIVSLSEDEEDIDDVELERGRGGIGVDGREDVDERDEVRVREDSSRYC